MQREVEQRLREFKEGLFVAAPVIIEAIKTDEDHYKDQRADVRLKSKHKSEKPPKILDVPISHKESATFSERQMPEVDDVAWVVFTNRAIDKALEEAGKTTPEHDRVLDINDCYLAGEWSVKGEGIPRSIGSMKKEDWLIGFHRDEQSRIYMRFDNGNIVLEPPPGEEISLELTEDPEYHVPKFERIAEKFNKHGHPNAPNPPDEQFKEEDRSDRVGVDD